VKISAKIASEMLIQQRKTNMYSFNVLC